jgi:phenylalanine-4-hydroxylase
MPQTSLESLPPYLRRYCTIQDYDKYTSRDHAAWRYIMRQSREYFRDNAVSVYLEGLKKTGIPLDRIPKVSEMDQALREFGWGAVPVCGFIPPIEFLDLQARGILPIATDMRSIEHIAYTPAPDIVHEAAGHAPIIADPSYREYLRQYARMAERTIMSSEDLALYEAIRVLSDIKENPDTKPGPQRRRPWIKQFKTFLMFPRRPWSPGWHGGRWSTDLSVI